MTDVITTSEKRDLKHLKELRQEMEKLYMEKVSKQAYNPAGSSEWEGGQLSERKIRQAWRGIFGVGGAGLAKILK